MKEVQNIVDAIDNKNGAEQLVIAQVGVQWLDLLLRKNASYGSSVWKVPVLTPNLAPRTAILVRMSDKIDRLKNLLAGGTDSVGESLNDTMADLGAYCLLYLAAPTK